MRYEIVLTAGLVVLDFARKALLMALHVSRVMQETAVHEAQLPERGGVSSAGDSALLSN